MKALMIVLSCAACLSAGAQSYYYYNDIILTGEDSRTMQTLLKNKVQAFTATGVTPEGSRATDFAERHEITENGKALKVSSIVNFIRNTVCTRFDGTGKLLSVADTSTGLVSLTTYYYDNSGRITRIENKTKDDSSAFSETEVHQWYYAANGKPEKMWRIKNGNDSLEIRFIPEENGNPGEEVSYRNGRETDHVYYYYDEKNRITDIVRFNKKAGKLMPEMIISYDDNDNVLQKIISSDGDNYGLRNHGSVLYIRYVIWRYVFNKQGLKTKEALFNKEQEMTGKIEYNYSFN